LKINALPALARFFLKTKVLRKKIPLIASFKLTYNCNLKCAPCPFHSKAGMSGTHISWDDAVKAIMRLKRTGCLFVIFEGGEPLMWKDGTHDFNDLALIAKKHFISVGVTTNGTLPLDVQTDILWVSIDGINETHDRLRSNSFDKAVSNIRNSTHKKLLVHFTFNRLNFKEFEELSQFVTGIPQVKGITVQFFYPYGQGEEDLSLSPYERRLAVETIIRLKKKGVPILNSCSRLRAMIDNSWKCREWLLSNVTPDGNIFSGCYVKGLGSVNCKVCGFTPVAEASGAYNFFPESLFSGLSIFLK
jgi:MoaA/NifB/PqqE/SkfB family radical SAM enzyme